jgi:hypothetical protein
MDLTGGRTTLTVNLFGLLMACVVTAETVFVVSTAFGHVNHSEVWGEFLPVVTMFIVRERIFSYIFLSLYVLLSLSVAQDIWLINAGTPVHYDAIGVTLFQSVFALLSIVCMSIYVFFCSIGFVVRRWQHTSGLANLDNNLRDRT